MVLKLIVLLGQAINDSPVGLAFYILEKFITGGNYTWRNNFVSEEFQKKFPFYMYNITFYSQLTQIKKYFKSN